MLKKETMLKGRPILPIFVTHAIAPWSGVRAPVFEASSDPRLGRRCRCRLTSILPRAAGDNGRDGSAAQVFPTPRPGAFLIARRRSAFAWRWSS
eukprot:7737819-Pyramimonas_sp.AAC.1